MQPARRDILKYAGAMSAAATGMCGARQALASSEADSHGPALSPETKGVLVDLTQCVGCRLCEYECKKANGIEPGALASYDDTTVFREKRRPRPTAYTVVNAYPSQSGATTTGAASESPVYAKVNCLHCNHASCVSACIVGALSKEPSGAVVYDSWKCIGCRYCMVACPFQIPNYEYENVLTPQVRKCEFCEPRTKEGKLPACVEGCPRQAMTFGRRDQLLEVARKRIAENPGRYQEHIYGEHEVGGTSWMYLSPVPFEQAGFLKVGNEAPGKLTEAIQHGVFKYWAAPIGLYTFFSGAYWFTSRRAKLAAANGAVLDADVEDEMLVGAGAGDGHRAHDNPRSLLNRQPGHHHGDQKGHSNHGHHAPAEPVKRKLLTPGTLVLLAMVLVGAAFGLYRFIFGLAAATNLDQEHPWGLWIAMDVGSGIALAGGGFMTAALVHIFHREHYHAIARSALVCALLGYTFYVPGLLADLGRYYNLWHTMLPSMWQGNSVLFEVGMCVMIYLNVQYAEVTPIICERLMKDWKSPRLASWLKLTHDSLEKIMPALLILGVTLSTFHQSSLGNLMVIAPYKLHQLWWTPVSPIFFLLSAMMVGFPMVIFTILFASWSLNRKPEMHVLSKLSRYVAPLLAAYTGIKVWDMVHRGTYSYLGEWSLQSSAWLFEMALVVVPMIMLLFKKVRDTPRLLGAATLMVILGVVVNRLNVFIIGYHPPYAEKTYIPSITEFALSLGLVAGLVLVYRVAVTYLPILQPAPAAEEQES